MQVLIKKADVLDEFKSPTNVADAIEITPQAVGQWGEYVPDPSVGKIMAVAPSIPFVIVRSKPSTSGKKP